jgi:hypothetical protein
VGELIDPLAVGQPALSAHLDALERRLDDEE